MTSIASGLHHVRALNQAVADHQAQAHDFAQQSRDALKEVRDQLIAGGTTHDSFLDFAIVNFASIIDEVVNFFRELDAKVRAHSGQLVLTVQPYEVERMRVMHAHDLEGDGHRGIVGPPGPEIRYMLGLGVLNGEGLDLTHRHEGEPPAALIQLFPYLLQSDPDHRSLKFPTGCAAYVGQNHHPEAVDQPLTLVPVEVARLLPTRRTGLGDFFGDHLVPKQVEVLIGNEAVFKWFETHYESRTPGAQMCELIGGPVNDFPGYTEYRQHRLARIHNDLAGLQQEEARRAKQQSAEEKREEIRRKLEKAIAAGFGQDEQIIALCQQYGVTVPA